MKSFLDMTLVELAQYNAGMEILAIGKGEFSDEVFRSADRVLKWKAARDEANKPQAKTGE